MIRALGLFLSLAYAALIVWLYAAQPQTMAEVTGGLASQVGVYRIDEQAFGDGLAFFRRDAFVEARAAFAPADPAQRDARTQFYIAYSFYRQGWGRVYNDDALFAKGLDRSRSRDRRWHRITGWSWTTRRSACKPPTSSGRNCNAG